MKRKIKKNILLSLAVLVIGILYMAAGPFKGRSALTADEILTPSVIVPYILIVLFIFIRSYFHDDDE